VESPFQRVGQATIRGVEIMKNFMTRRYEKYGYAPVGLLPTIKFLFNRAVWKFLKTFGIKYAGLDWFERPFKLNDVFYCINNDYYFKASDRKDFDIIFGMHESFQDEYIRKNLVDGSRFIDIGAHMGRFTLLGARSVGKNGLVLSLEPDQRVFQQLLENISLNKYQNIISLPVAAFNDNDLVSFKISKTSGWSSLTDMHKDSIFNEVHIPAFKLDTIIESLKIESVDLIKIDVEGAEDKVLEGATKILEKFIPKLLIEIHENESWSKCEKMLGDHGYEYEVIHRDPTSPEFHFHIYAYSKNS